MNTALWIVVGVLVWFVLAVVVGLSVGQVVRLRERGELRR